MSTGRPSSQPGPLGETPRQVADRQRQLAQGKIDAVGSVTLTANAASTTVSTQGAIFCANTSVILFSPRTANAAAALATLYVTPGNQSFVINHANNAQTDRTFGYAVLG